jgi:hypothetical protein
MTGGDMVVRGPFSEKLVEYAITVVSWSYFYSYIADPLTRLEVDEFIHLETLEFQGKLTSPRDRVGLPAKLMIACEKVPVDEQLIRYDRPVLGNLDTKKKLLEAYVLLPSTHVTRLTAIASSDRITRVRLMATKTFRRRALVRSINVSTEA